MDRPVAVQKVPVLSEFQILAIGDHQFCEDPIVFVELLFMRIAEATATLSLTFRI